MPTPPRPRIPITRSRAQASELARLLTHAGADPITLPTIELVPPGSFEPLDTALAQLPSFDWLLFTSANAVEVFASRRDPSLTPKRIAAIGPATARAITSLGLRVDLTPPHFVAESLAAALLPHLGPASRILLIRAATARDILPQALTSAGAHLTIADAYQTILPPGSLDLLRHLFADTARHPHAATFTSSSTARNLTALLEAAGLTLPPTVLRASIGPITSATLRELNLTPHLEAAEPTIPSLVAAIAAHFGLPFRPL